jgi:hypothetical protein
VSLWELELASLLQLVWVLVVVASELALAYVSMSEWALEWE